MPELRTDRLLLRPWRSSDVAPWVAINADPQVREHLGGGPLTREQSAAAVAGFQADLDRRGYGSG
jgi:RimJ/RimL family protein N-acetyltransferase